MYKERDTKYPELTTWIRLKTDNLFCETIVSPLLILIKETYVPNISNFCLILPYQLVKNANGALTFEAEIF